MKEFESNQNSNRYYCTKHAEYYTNEQGCPYCIGEQLCRPKPKQRGFIRHIAHNWVVFHSILIFVSLFAFVFTYNTFWGGLLALTLVTAPFLSSSLRLLPKLAASVLLLLFIGLVSGPYTSSYDKAQVYDIETIGYSTSDGTKERPYSIGEVGFFRDTTIDDVEVGEVALTINSVKIVVDEIIEIVNADSFYNQDIKSYLVDIASETASESNYKYIIINITYTNLTSEVCGLDYSQFKVVAGAKIIVSHGRSYSNYALENLYGDYSNKLNLKNIDGALIFQGESVTGDIILAVAPNDPNPLLIYGDSLAWYSLVD